MPEGGRIIVIGSVNGDRMPVPGMAAYALSKSALQGMARGLARDFGPRGITINVVQPGPIDTDANPADGPMKDLLHGFMAIKRHGRPEEVAWWHGSPDRRQGSSPAPCTPSTERSVPDPLERSTMATIGIIGAGEVGSQIARAAIANGYRVVIANSRGPETLARLVAELGPDARAATAADAAEAGDFVVVAVPSSSPTTCRSSNWRARSCSTPTTTCRGVTGATPL